MHQTRKEISVHLPLPKKGTKYIARAFSNLNDAVPVVVAVRDMLKLANTSAEVKAMIHNKLLKLNWKLVNDHHQPIQLFQIFEADKPYMLTILPTSKFTFEHTTAKERLCKIISRKLVSNNKLQINLHDGTNLIGKDSMNIGDTLYLDSENKVKSHKPLEKGASVFIVSGKYCGSKGTVVSILDNEVKIKFGKEEATLRPNSVFVQ